MKERIRSSLKFKVLIVLSTVVFVLTATLVWMDYMNFIHSSETFSDSTATTVAETCRLIINNETLEGYAETGRRDTYYYEIWNKLIDYRNTNEDIVKLSVVWFDEELCHYYFDTDLTDSGAFLGDSREYDSKQEMIKADLINGHNIEPIVYSNRIDVYKPLFSTFNIPLGYVVVGISTLNARRQQLMYLCKLVGIMFVLVIIATLLSSRYFNKGIVNPINALAKASSNYAKYVNDKDYVSPFKALNINTGDEIERLYHAIQKMEEDLLSSSNNLSIAMWNSNHDSMTQLYNKRYLADRIQGFLGEKYIAAFYFDVDNLKKMNDICGHEQGDAVICQTASFIRKYSSESCPGFRIGGDEFLLLVCGKDAKETEELYNQMKNDQDRILTKPDSLVACRISIGYAFGEGSVDLDMLIKKADAKMYQDKQSHRT